MFTGGIYIHVPFCLSKCYYCDFYSIKDTPLLIEEYLSQLEKEVSIGYDHYPMIAKTLYFGGGTPSILTARQIDKVISQVVKKFNLNKDSEITIEVNPDTVSLEQVRLWKKIGINRISMGVQSTSNKVLKVIGRRHNKAQVVEALKIFEKVGFSNINVDIMYGLPYQREDMVIESLEECLKFDISHISAYPLQIEENTKLEELLTLNKLVIPTDTIVVEMLFKIKQFLESKGFLHYEIANYARKGFHSKHNLLYWKLEPYLGFGPAAASYYNNKRFCNSNDFNIWKNEIGKMFINLDKDSNKRNVQMAEYCFLSLRLLKKGLSEIDFFRRFNINLDKIYGDTLKELTKKSMLNYIDGTYYLTKEYIPLANQVFMEFLPSIV